MNLDNFVSKTHVEMGQKVLELLGIDPSKLKFKFERRTLGPQVSFVTWHFTNSDFEKFSQFFGYIRVEGTFDPFANRVRVIVGEFKPDGKETT